MEIDLERPSGHGDKLDIEDTDVIDEANGMCAEKEDFASPRSSRHSQENAEANLDKPKSGDGNNEGVTSYEPHNGLEFETKEAAYSFYREYARSVGFGITIKASRRSKKSGKFIDVKIACSRFGNKPESGSSVNSRSCPKTGCKASMHMKRKPVDGKWFIYSFVKEHNHEICPDDFYYSIRGRNKQFGIVACKKKGLQLALNDGDMKMLLENLMLLQAENPSFWYSIDLDQEKKLRNVFWVDAKGRNDYGDFFDAIIIDTNYVRNKYNIPSVPIIGVNHHFQFILLGCALIGDETTSTFVWLMRTWLKAVGGQTPRVIMTDEDKSLKEAIAEVFPDARHCFCLWHVLRKIPENLSHVMNRFENFMVEFNKCIYRSWTDEEFEKGWCEMVNRFELREDEWIQSLYEDRKRWVPTYMRETFLAGLSTAERSESISSFFDNYMNRETTLHDFFDHYKVLLHSRYEEEAKADFDTRQEKPTLRSRLPFEKQMSSIYTHAIFNKFQVEVLGVPACNLEKTCEGETTISFRVDDFEQRQNFIVTWNEAESEICCLCHSFEYRGFLCRHAMLVLQKCGVSNIPSRYILKRWTKLAKIRQITSETSHRLHYRVIRFNNICKFVVRLVEEGSLSQETCDIAFSALEEALKQCVEVNESARSVLYPDMLATQGMLNSKEGNERSNMGKTTKRKKVQRKRKVQGDVEAIAVRMQDNTPQMEGLNRRSHALDVSYVLQRDIHLMDLGPRTPNLGGSYSSQQSVQGVGQVSSFSSMQECYYPDHPMQALAQPHSTPTRVGHYCPQQSLQELLQGPFNLRTPTMHAGFDMDQSGHIMSKNLQDDEHLPR